MTRERADATFTTSNERRVPYLVCRGNGDDPRLRLGPDGTVRVILPEGETPTVNTVLEANRDWIERQCERQRERIKHIKQQYGDLTNGLVVWGYVFDFETRNGQYGIEIDSGMITVSTPTGRSSIVFLKNRLASRLRDTVVSIADQIVPEIEGSYDAVQIRNQETKWASYSTTGTLSFNVRCAFLPVNHIRYLVTHELAHSVNPSHDPEFWSLVETVVDDPKQRSNELEGFAVTLGRNEIWNQILEEW